MNADQLDTDDNGIGDVCDEDVDDDEILNELDNCPLVAHPSSWTSIGTVMATPAIAIRAAMRTRTWSRTPSTTAAGLESHQEDTNENGVGDACDEGDGVLPGQKPEPIGVAVY